MTHLLTIQDQIHQHKSKIYEWLTTLEGNYPPPFYSSVDIRDSGFKYSVIDTNLFPAGFNNICSSHLDAMISILQTTILKRVPHCKTILIVAEDHTRNTWYLEHLYVLSQFLKNASFIVHIAMSSDVVLNETLTLSTALNHTIDIINLNHIQSHPDIDFIILNNDLTAGIPNALLELDTPIAPDLSSGWFARSKTTHFDHYNSLITSFADLISIDPWFLHAIHDSVENISFDNTNDINRIYQQTLILFEKIQQKYDQYQINEKPFIFIKSAQGTYGMGVLAIESPSDILEINRRTKNKLSKGKYATPFTNFILQEGIPSNQKVNHHSSEICIYNMDNQFIGGFHRLNSEKSNRDNLNSKGMQFEKICFTTCNDQCNIHPNQLQHIDPLNIYHILSRIAGIAAKKELIPPIHKELSYA